MMTIKQFIRLKCTYCTKRINKDIDDAWEKTIKSLMLPAEMDALGVAVFYEKQLFFACLSASYNKFCL